MAEGSRQLVGSARVHCCNCRRRCFRRLRSVPSIPSFGGRSTSNSPQVLFQPRCHSLPNSRCAHLLCFFAYLRRGGCGINFGSCERCLASVESHSSAALHHSHAAGSITTPPTYTPLALAFAICGTATFCTSHHRLLQDFKIMRGATVHRRLVALHKSRLSVLQPNWSAQRRRPPAAPGLRR
jgi:hypothetical protein